MIQRRDGWRAARRWAAWCAALLAAPVALAQDGGGATDSGGGFGGPGSVLLLSAAETLVLDSVRIISRVSTGDAAANTALIARLRAATGPRPGDRLSQAGLELVQARRADLRMTGLRQTLEPAGGVGRATWAEGWVEFGLGGVSRIRASNAAVYGAVFGVLQLALGLQLIANALARP